MREVAAPGGARLHVQQAVASGTWVIHDAALLTAELKVGQRLRIAYEQGVARVRKLRRKPSTPENEAGVG